MKTMLRWFILQRPGEMAPWIQNPWECLGREAAAGCVDPVI